MSKVKFKKSIKGAFEFYESIEKYEDRLLLREEFEAAVKQEEIKSTREERFYKWLRDNKL